MELDHVKLLKLIEAYQENPRMCILEKLYFQLLPATKFEIQKVIQKLHLPDNFRKDMEQDAFIKLLKIAKFFDTSRKNTALAYWKMALRNDLLSNYYSKRTKVNYEIESAFEEADYLPDREILHRLRDSFLARISTWPNSKHQKLASIILKRRFFPDDGIRTPQPELAQELNITQSTLSRWETWIKANLIIQAEQIFGPDIM